MKASKHILLTGICMLWFCFRAMPQLCPNNALAPVFQQDFGQGANSGSTSTAPAGSTNYNFGGVGTDGNYILTPLFNNANKSDWTKGGDHTGNTNGNMFLVNAGGNKSVFFKQTVNGLCSGSTFNFSAWLANANTSSTVGVCGAGTVYAKVIFNIKDLSGTLLASYTTINLPLSPVNGPANWQQYGFQFTLPNGTSSLILEMVDFYGGANACGNDLALDDILFTACTPQVNVSLSTASSSVCAGSNVTINSTLVNSPFTSPAYQWQKSTDNGTTWLDIGTAGTSANSFPINNIASTDGALYRILVGPNVSSLSSLTCVTASNPISLTVLSVPVLTVASSPLACTGLSLSLTSTVSSGATPYSYSWTGPNAFSSTSPNNSIPSINFSASGTYQLTVTDANSCTANAQTIVAVQQSPAISIVNIPGINCTSSSVAIQSTSTISGSQFFWTPSLVSGTATGFTTNISGTANGNITDSLSNTSNIAAKILYTISTRAPSGCLATDTTSVTVLPPTTNLIDTSSQTICANQSITIVGQPATGGNGTYQYQWEKSIDGISWTLLPGATAASLVFTPDTTMQLRRNILSYSCNTISYAVRILVQPALNNNIIAANQQICIGNNAQPIIGSTPIGGNSIYQYQWQLSTDSGLVFNNILNATSKDFTPGMPLVSSWFKRLVTSSLCNGPQSNTSNTIAIIVNAIPMISLSGTGTICSGAVLSISSTVTVGAAPFTYQWTGPNTFNSNLAHISLPNVSTAAGGNYRLTLTDANGCITNNQMTIIVNQSPVLTFQTTTDTICNANALAIQLNSSIANTTFQWSASLVYGTASGYTNNLTGTTTGMINDFITNSGNNLASIAYQVTANTVLGCTATGNKNAFILPAIINQIDIGSKTVCYGQVVSINGQNASGGNGSYQYQWEKTIDGTNWILMIGSNNASVTFTPDTTMQIRRTINSFGCNSVSTAYSITVQTSLSNNSITGNQQICVGTNTQLIMGSIPSGGNGAYQYQWQMSTDSGLNWAVINGEINKDINPGVLTVPTWYRRLIGSGFCTGAQSTVSNKVLVDVKLTAKASIRVGKNIGCAPFIIDSSLVTAEIYPQRNSSYQWYLNNSFAGSGTQFPRTILTTDSLMIKLITTSGFGCNADSMETMVRLYQSPKPEFQISDSTGCGMLSIKVTNTTMGMGNFQYAWDLGNGQQSLQAQPGTIQYPSGYNGNDTTYRITLKAFQYCDTVSVSKNIIVSRKAKLNFSAKLINTCSPLKAEFYNYSQGKEVQYTLSFGDGLDTTINANGSYAHTYHTGNNVKFLARLIAANGCGADTTTIPIAVLPNPVKADLKMADTAVCGYPYTLSINNNTLAASSFTWDYGDGSAVETSTTRGLAKHLYQQPGSYLIKNIITSYCSDSVVNRHINIYSAVKAISTRVLENNCIGTPVKFDNLSDPDLSAQWQLGDRRLSDSFHLTHLFTEAGKYTMGLRVWRTHTDITCADTTAQTFTIVAIRKGQFTPTDTLGKCIPFVLSFQNKQNPGIATTWNWGDGSISTGDTLKHSFNANGQYTVTMAALQPGGCLFVDSALITVKAPEMKVVYKGGSYCKLNTLIEFKPSTNYTDSIRWNFGDGSVLTTVPEKVVHTYTTAGSYVPKVTLLNAANCAIEVSLKEAIQIDEIKPGFKLTVMNECAKSNYGLKDTSAAYFPITKRVWSTGTQQPANFSSLGSTREIVQTYTKAGNYEASLNVENQIGCQAAAHAKYNVLVYEYPKANINAISQTCLYNLMELRSNINSKDSLLGRYWNLGNGSIATDSVVNITYSNAGNYTVKLTVATVNSCYDSAAKQLSIHPLPQITLAPEKNVCKGDSLELKATGALGYIWKDQYENVLCNNCSTVKMLPQKNLTYKVVGYNEFGCTNIASTNVHIVEPFKIALKSVDSICAGSSKKIFVNGAASYTWLPTPGLSSYTGSSPYATPANTTTYQVIGKDAYQCFADTASIKLVVGRPTLINIGKDTTVISGTPIKLNTGNPSPDIVQWKWGGKADYSCVYCASPKVKVIMDESLYCTATNQFGCVTTDTIQVKTFCSGSEVFIPNAFTPDGDGINDVLVVQGRGIKIIKSMRIFSRWGEVVFEKTNFQPGDRSAGWDGKVRGKQGNTDVYIYLCEAVCERGTPYVFKGNVAIIK